MPRVTIAQTDMLCLGCGSLVDVGSLAILRATGTTHPNCEPRTETLPADAAPRDGFLFAMGETGETPMVPGRSKVRAFVEVSAYVGQRASVFEVMRDGRFRTLEEIAKATGYLETSVSARLREMKHPEFGGHGVIHQPVCEGSSVREYRLIVNGDNEQRSAA